VLRAGDTPPQASAGRKIRVAPFSPALGGEVRGIDLADGLDDAAHQEVRAAFLRYGVLFFKEQSEIPPSVQVAIGRMFGELHMHPAAPQMPGYPEVFVIHAHRESKVANGEFWHSDVSCDEVPPLGTMLQIHVLPEIGGDTLFANMYAAYDALSPPMRRMLDGLTARHESEHIYRGRYSDRGVDDAGKVRYRLQEGIGSDKAYGLYLYTESSRSLYHLLGNPALHHRRLARLLGL